MYSNAARRENSTAIIDLTKTEKNETRLSKRHIPVVASIIRHTGTLCIEHPLVVAGAVAEKYTGVVKQIVA